MSELMDPSNADAPIAKAEPESMERDLMGVRPSGLAPGETVPTMEEEETPTPEEQATYEKFMKKAARYIHGPKSDRAVVDMINQKHEPVHVNVGRAVTKIGQMVEQTAKSAKTEIDSAMLRNAAVELSGELLDKGIDLGIFPLEKDSPEYDKALELSVLEATKNYGEDLLKGPDGKQLSARAQDEYARQVAMEADRGEVDPTFARQMQQTHNLNLPQLNPVAAGVKEAVAQ